MQEMQFLSLVWEDPLEKEMTAHSDILAGKIQWTEEPGMLQSMRSQRFMSEHEHMHAGTYIGLAWCINLHKVIFYISNVT